MIVCLLPVRDAGQDLRSWLAAAPTWCDGVIALDDGSTDDTRSTLEASPTVLGLLTHPVRRSAAGWDDSRNRRELLDAAGELSPDWVVWVDADERFASDDAAALRSFIQGDALPGIAYGVRHCRMWGNDRYDPRTPWVYRFYAWRSDLSLPDGRLHFNPVAQQIPRRAWVRTSLRLQHFGAADEAGVRARREKYAASDPDRVFPIDFGGMDRSPVTTVSWVGRSTDESVVLGPDAAFGAGPIAEDVARSVAEDERPLVAALLPVRNGEGDLPGWFDRIALVADVVVALDDGSTDRTRSILASHPSVKRLLTRPLRPDHTGWDDAANRQLLLAAAGELRPRWILWLDVDERLSPDDAQALRAFIEHDAEPDVAYGFRVHRMIDDESHYDRDDLWVYRLFAWKPGMRFSTERLHLVPIPDEIPPDRWRRTTIRIQHLASLTGERRLARFQKYREADPDFEFQDDYGDLLEGPGEVSTWEERAADLAVILGADRPSQSPEAPVTNVIDLDAPILSAIVIARDDKERIARTLRSVVLQEVPEPFEVVAVVSGSDGTADVVRREFPDVHIVDLGPGPASPGRARNAGLAVARGDFVSFPGSHIVLPQGSLAARIRAHELGYPMVTGSMRNLNRSPAGWASYFLDHSSVLPGSPSGEIPFAPPHCSYDRELLMQVGGFPEDLRAGEDTVVNMTLFGQGRRAWRANDVELFHASPCRDLPGLVCHHFRRGRGLGRIMLEGVPPGGRILGRAVLRKTGVGYMPARVRATRSNVLRFGDRELRDAYRTVRGLVFVGIMAAWAGTWWELVRPAEGKLRTLIGTPALHIVIAGLDRREGFPVGRPDVLLLARVDILRGRVALLAPPRDLLVDLPGVGPIRLNEAYEHGASNRGGDEPRAGMRLLAETFRGAFGLRVDGTVLVDFAGFVRVVDAVGGVLVDVEHAIDDEFTGEDGAVFSAHFPSGPQRLDGAAALTYARTRKADGDRWRRNRHTQLVVALVQAASEHPWSTLGIAAAVRAAVRTDVGFARLLVGGVGMLRAVRNGRVRTVPLVPPAVRSQRLLDRRWVHIADPGAVTRELRERFLSF